MESALNDKMFQPTDELLTLALGGSAVFWYAVKKHIAETYGQPHEEWKFYGKCGWTTAVFSGKRRLVNMVPHAGFFRLNFTLGERGAAAVRISDLPDSIKALIPNSPQCVCGHTFNVEVRTAADAETAKKLLEIKSEN